ncbi:MAG TPA: DbpA RNA binding domain-containing protein [Gemmatimonadales bacterium]|nr:DbpA RNA binding domain-containing protein [Gemmatimonadales bacterium]
MIAPDMERLQLTAAVGDALGALGWTADDARVREVAPTAARGHGLVLITPPAAAYAAPALAGLISRLANEGGRALVIAPAPELAEWGALTHALSRASALRVQTAHGVARAARRLKAESLDLLVASPAATEALLFRGALKAASLRAVVVAGPERWDSIEALELLMGDLPADAQRVIIAADPDVAARLSERYARRALALGAPPPDAPPPAPVGPVRTVGVAWERRASVLADLLEVLDPGSLTVWTADRSRHAAIGAALPGGDSAIRVVTGDVPKAEVIVAFDPPDVERLRRLADAGEVVLLVPPGTERWIARIAGPRRALRLPGLVDAADAAARARRALVVRAIEGGAAERSLLALGPLLERYDPTAVAAALYDLWSATRPATSASAAADDAAAGEPPAMARAAGSAKVFVGVGRKDGATPNDLVAVLTKEVRVPKDQIGRIEVRDNYMLVELPAGAASRIADALSGREIRRKRVTAKLDRGRERGAPPGNKREGPEPDKNRRQRPSR